MLRSKKSSCVKEVEKIKQRRTERRAAQMAVREHNVHDYDVSAPSWEFDVMIRSVISAQFHLSNIQLIGDLLCNLTL